MKLTHFQVTGFRSLRSLSTTIEPYTCVIGRNDSGKSSLLRAIHLLLDPNESALPSDFSTLDATSSEIRLQGEFSECSNPLIAPSGTAKLRRVISSSSDRYEYLGLVPVSATLREMQAGTMTKKGFSEASDITDDVKSRASGLPEGKLSREQWKDFFDDLVAKGNVAFEPGWLPMSTSDVANLFEVIFLTADMRAAEEAADGAKSLFGRLGGLLYREACRSHPALIKKQQELETLLEQLTTRDEDGKWSFASVQKLEDVLQEELARFDPEVRVKPRAEAARMPQITFPLRLDVEDDYVSGFKCMGHGLQRSLVFAMLRTLARMPEIVPLEEGTPEPADAEKLKVFLIEEPELYLHPQAERERMIDLVNLAGNPSTLVVACTHSAFFVDIFHYRSIRRLVRRDRKDTECFEWSGPELSRNEKNNLQMVRAMHPTSAAALFSDLAILAEGETEVGCLPHLARGLNLKTQGVEIVDCGGAASVPMLCRICNSLGIRFTAWFDQDRPDEIQKVINETNRDLRALVVLTPDWEAVGEVPTGDRSKPWRSYKHFVLDKNQPPPALVRAIEAAFNHQDLDMRSP